MFRITEDPSSGTNVQCFAKNYKNGSIVSVDMDVAGFMANYKIFKSAPTCSGSQRIHHHGALYSALLKITRMVLLCLLIWTWSVLWQIIKYLKALQRVSDHRGSIISDPCTMLG